MRINIETISINCNIQMIRQLSEASLKIEEEDEIEVDITNFNYVTPYSMLLLGAAIRSWRRSGKFVNVIYESDPKKFSYLEHLGFLDLIDEETVKLINKTPSSITCVPLKKISREMLAKCKGNNIVNAIEEVADDISETITDIIENQQHFSYLITEMVRNSFEHAEVEEVFLIAQKWPSLNMVEIAIMDEGVGIKKTLKSKVGIYSTKKSWENYDYLDYALRPGVSAESNVSYAPEGFGNSGYGLYIAKEICKSYDGGFIISSDKWSLFASKRIKGLNVYRKNSFPYMEGVSMQLRFYTNNMENFNSVRESIVANGEKHSKDNFKASKASKGEKNWL